MAEGLYERVQKILKAREMSEEHLEKLMSDRGIRYRLVFLDTFASPDDIRVIAGLLRAPPSVLFEVSTFVNELIEALMEEMWSQHEGRIELSKQESLRRVRQSEFRLNSPGSTVRSQVELAFKALHSSSRKVFGCEYPDCSCITRCAVTGALDRARGIEVNWTRIRAKALELAESKGLEYNDQDSPQTRLRRLASELGVDRLELHEMEGDALVIERTAGQYTMFLNRGHVKSRHRFSTAHEVAHLLASPIIGHRSVHRRRFSSDQDDEGRRLEILCNDMASAILMPRKRVEAVLDQTGQTARCVPSLIENFGVSFEAAARRYVNVVSSPCVLVKWTTKARARKEERPISNFPLRGGFLKFQETTSSTLSHAEDLRNVGVSKEHVVIYPGRYSRLTPIHVEDTLVETLCHGRGQYRRMYSFVYLPSQLVTRLQPSPGSRRARR